MSDAKCVQCGLALLQFCSIRASERDMVQTVTHRVAGEVKFVARPLRFDGKPPAPSTPPPTLGEHTVEVFENWLEWTRTEVLDFASKGAFGDLALKQSAE